MTGLHCLIYCTRTTYTWYYRVILYVTACLYSTFSPFFHSTLVSLSHEHHLIGFFSVSTLPVFAYLFFQNSHWSLLHPTFISALHTIQQVYHYLHPILHFCHPIFTFFPPCIPIFSVLDSAAGCIIYNIFNYLTDLLATIGTIPNILHLFPGWGRFQCGPVTYGRTSIPQLPGRLDMVTPAHRDYSEFSVPMGCKFVDLTISMLYIYLFTYNTFHIMGPIF